MKLKLIALATAATMTFGAVNAMEVEHQMITDAVYNVLDQLNVDTANVGDLTLNQIAQIRAIVGGEESESEKRQRVEAIINNN